jgi:hypothetical protein
VAEAEKKTKVVRTEFVEVKLSVDEANTLRAVLSMVAGSPTNSPRKHVDSVSDALKNAGIDGGIERRLIGRPIGSRSGLEFGPYPGETASPLDDLLFGATSKAWGRING